LNFGLLEIGLSSRPVKEIVFTSFSNQMPINQVHFIERSLEMLHLILKIVIFAEQIKFSKVNTTFWWKCQNKHYFLCGGVKIMALQQLFFSVMQQGISYQEKNTEQRSVVTEANLNTILTVKPMNPVLTKLRVTRLDPKKILIMKMITNLRWNPNVIWNLIPNLGGQAQPYIGCLECECDRGN
jgi:hypothetical protein